MTWLRQYTVPSLLALALHVAAMMALYSGWNPDREESRLIKPQMVLAELIVLPPKVKRPPPTPKVVVKKSRPEEVPAPEVKVPEPAVVDAQPDPDEIRRKQELEALRNKLREWSENAFADALENEANDLAASEEADEEAMKAASYRYGIYQLIVDNWSRPPSARNNMQAKLLVELVPTGDVVSVTILEASGNEAFDRSAEAAVRKARRFEVPVESKLFERYFRRFTLLFRPEDLLR